MTKLQMIWRYGKQLLFKLMRTNLFLVLEKIKCLVAETSKFAVFLEKRIADMYFYLKHLL